MPRRLQAAVSWAAVLVVAAALIGLSGYTSRDPDSTAYAQISARMSTEPWAAWLAPQWWGAWNFEGPFREHPVGILLLPAALASLGFPAEQAAYALGAVASALAIVLLGVLASSVLKPHEAAAVRWAALILPVAFVYRIRANQEYPVLVLMLIALIATEHARRQPLWIVGMVGAAIGLFLVKGIFVIFMPIACALWLLFVPSRESNDRPAWIGIAGSIVAVAVAVWLYERAYVHVAGDSFLRYYIETRLGSNTGLDRGTMPDVLDKVVNVGWYAARLVWFAVPGSLVLLFLAVRRRWPRREASALHFVLALGAAYVLVMSLGSNRAERFIFPAYFAVGAAGSVVAMRQWPAVDRAARWIDRLPAYGTPLLWLMLFLLTFVTGRGLPRVQL